LDRINEEAYQPYLREEISQEEALERMVVPLKDFMLRNTEVNTMETFLRLSNTSVQENPQDYPLTVVVPAFMTSELKTGFLAGFLIYLPFLLVDIIVSTTLMSMGMVMLPPAMISLPFKLLLFVTVNGWELLFESIVTSFH
jgi:flagellar biosynthetic protein FliP